MSPPGDNDKVIVLSHITQVTRQQLQSCLKLVISVNYSKREAGLLQLGQGGGARRGQSVTTVLTKTLIN